jgi:hypothetical protein
MEVSQTRSIPSRRAYLLATLFAVALVALPFWFWYDTWFGRRLPDQTVEEYLHSQDRPRRIQQALVQIEERMARGDGSARRWYPRVIELASHANREIRQTVAWIMGQDRGHEPFRPALHRLRNDPEPMVRRNAALGLAALRDDSGREEIRAMLRPSIVTASKAGRVQFRLQPGDYSNPGTLLARIDDEELRASLPGEVREKLVNESSFVSKGQPLIELSPDEEHAREALRALFLVGNREDLDDVRRFLRSPNAKLAEQAQLTLRKIESR